MVNKDKNTILAITLNKDTATRLNYVVDDLSKSLNIALTKSQAIAILINNYKQPQITQPKPKESKPRTSKTALNYQSQLLALKDKLNVSYTHLSEILDIPTSTLKKYASGNQQPQGENEQKLINALKRYGIK